MKSKTITSVAKLINKFIADLTAKAQIHDTISDWSYDELDGDRFTVKVFENYNKIEIIHDGLCSECFRENGGAEAPSEKLTVLLEKRGWHCDDSNAYHTIYVKND
jgi:hypothetical protein